MTMTSLKLILLYELEYLNLPNDESVQSIINELVSIRHKGIIQRELNRARNITN